MARRSLKPQLNQIRTWVRQGRTDAWIAHQLDVSVGDIRSFKREHELAPAEAAETDGDSGAAGLEGQELDLRAEDDALVAAALDAERQAEQEAIADADEEESDADLGERSDEGDDADDQPRRRARRGRRGGRGRRRKATALEGTFDHGEEGYGLWLDPAVQEDPVYAEHWAGHRPVEVAVEPERIVITRAGEDPDED